MLEDIHAMLEDLRGMRPLARRSMCVEATRTAQRHCVRFVHMTLARCVARRSGTGSLHTCSAVADPGEDQGRQALHRT